MKQVIFIAFLCGASLISQASPTYFRSNIIGGEQADFSEYPEVVHISDGRGGCTGTLIGPRALITAAHCVERSKNIFVLKNKSFTNVTGVCESSDLYKAEDHDLALCLLSQSIDAAWASLSFERVGLHEVVSHLGYGCTSEDGTGGNDGKLKIGEAQVLKLSNPPADHSWVAVGDGLCFGDSGGPAFSRLRNPLTEKHVLVGVNSKGNIKDINIAVDLGTLASYEFVEGWAQKNRAEICGYNINCD